MISVSTKLTLLVLALPIGILFLLDLAIFHYYKTSIEVSALLSAILVFLLVWERLRNSLSKKLEYLHDNYLFELYQAFQREIVYFWSGDIKKIKPDLEKYGKFMGISLYPRGLVKEIDNFLVSYDEFDERLLKIKDIGKRQFKARFNQGLWYHLLGIKHLEERRLQDIDRSVFELHTDKAEKVKKEQAKLIEETTNLLEEGERMRMKIFERLEDFLQSNNLRLKEKSHYPYLSYP